MTKQQRLLSKFHSQKVHISSGSFVQGLTLLACIVKKEHQRSSQRAEQQRLLSKYYSQKGQISSEIFCLWSQYSRPASAMKRASTLDGINFGKNKSTDFCVEGCVLQTCIGDEEGITVRGHQLWTRQSSRASQSLISVLKVAYFRPASAMKRASTLDGINFGQDKSAEPLSH
jgi:hypothetical protein